MINRDDIVAEARKYLGVRWRHMGRDMSGLDCVGLCVVVFRAFGFDMMDDGNRDYRRTDTAKFAEMVKKYSVLGSKQNIRPGSILIMRQAQFPGHIGFASLKDGVMHVIHASVKDRQIVEQPMLDMWDLIVDVREMPGVK